MLTTISLLLHTDSSNIKNKKIVIKNKFPLSNIKKDKTNIKN